VGASPGSAAGTGSQPASAPDSSKPLRVGGDVKPPKAVYDPDPQYSEAARRAHYQGTVVLWLVVTADGSPTKIRVARRIGMGLDEAAIVGVQRWHFQPATRNGQPVPVMVNVEVNFRLQGGGPDVSLQPPPEARSDPPQFPGADLAKYPLLVHIGVITGVPDGNSFQIVASAALREPGVTVPVSIECSGKKKECAFLEGGNYPARWLSKNQKLEIIGKHYPGNSWEKAEFTVK
jgi:TonB family protein